MNIKEIQNLIKLMNDNDLAEIEMEQDGIKIKLRKSESGIVANTPQGNFVMQERGLQAQAPDASKLAAQKEGQVIESPMVGTFYAAPAPDAEAFVKVGAKVEVGQVVCIIEAMKLMNEIKSEVKGKIAAVHPSNGDAVEFGQALFTVS